ncbi:Splicing factor 3B subunit 3 [Araneus ventricosus]|uniref:Splicing factor 3B subunit 3 n=1 Tax=Araneus ventricosus TaxID=182803 RepID=A0A4Y2QC07_ARAVE|nr:Splicing factor 3B subunit 3 [Araneus ventricosus]
MPTIEMLSDALGHPLYTLHCTVLPPAFCDWLFHVDVEIPGERGVLVYAEDFIAFYSLDSSAIIRCSIPKRIMDPKAGVIFVCSTKCGGKNPNLKDGSSRAVVSFASSTQNSIYYLAQTEQGDIFRIQLVINELGVNEIVIKYFITLPVASALCTFESGFLFVASEFGNHHVYKIADIENRARVHPSFSSALALPKGKPFLFMHRTLDIKPVAEIKSMSPIMHMEFEPLSSMRPRMCLAMGRASLSALKISKVERDVSYQSRAKIEKGRDEIPLRMWAIKSTVSISKESETLIVVSFEDSTAVYSLEGTSEYVIQKMEKTPFAGNTNTLCCAKTGEDAIVQVKSLY